MTKEISYGDQFPQEEWGLECGCPTPMTQEYSYTYDAFFCSKCNVWLDKTYLMCPVSPGWESPESPWEATEWVFCQDLEDGIIFPMPNRKDDYAYWLESPNLGYSLVILEDTEANRWYLCSTRVSSWSESMADPSKHPAWPKVLGLTQGNKCIILEKEEGLDRLRIALRDIRKALRVEGDLSLSQGGGQ